MPSTNWIGKNRGSLIVRGLFASTRNVPVETLHTQPMNSSLQAPAMRAWLFAATILGTTILFIDALPMPIAFGQAWSDAKVTEVLPLHSGIDFLHTDGSNGNRYMVETVIGSLAIFDYDNDGWLDIYFINGAPLLGTKSETLPRNHLYRNNRDWTFTDVTEASGLGNTQYGMGVVAGDFDQDGDGDVFISNFGTNVFYVNQGDGTFAESTKPCGLSSESRVGAGNSFFDMDNDGDLDLYCASYVEFEYPLHKTRMISGYQFHTGPNDYVPARHLLYRNDGDGRFTDVSEWSGLNQLPAPGMGVLGADFDGDGDADVFVANDQKPNFLLINDGQGRFHDEGIMAGVAVDRLGRSNGNMGVDYADFNGDGQLDLVTTTYQEEMPVLYQAIGPGLFADSTNIARIDNTLNAHVKWGVGGVDFDNDGDRDLFVACGHFLDNLRHIDDRTSIKVTNYLLANDGRGRFTNVTKNAGSALQVIESSRGAAFDDLDNDGDVDLVVLNVNSRPTVGRTDSRGTNNGYSVTLVGTSINRDAIGAKIVAVSESGKTQTHVVASGKGYESSYGVRTYFGTGTDTLKKYVVTWAIGKSESFDCDSVSMTLIEGHGSSQ